MASKKSYKPLELPTNIIDLCTSEEIHKAFTSIRDLRSKTKYSEESISQYLSGLSYQLASTPKNSKKAQVLLKEQRHVDQAMSEVKRDLESLASIEDTLAKLCRKIRK